MNEVPRDVQALVWGLMEWMPRRQRRSLFRMKGSIIRHRLKAAGFTQLCRECLLPYGENERKVEVCPDCRAGSLEKL